ERALGCEHAAKICAPVQFSSHTQTRAAAWKIREPINQRFSSKLRLDRFLEDIPERHVQIVDVAGAQELGRKRALFGKSQAKPLRRQSHSELKIRPRPGANALNDV